MASQDRYGWGSLRTEQIGSLGKEEFEEFCCALIEFEAYDRHDDPLVDSPAGASTPDGGRDILLTVSNPPVVKKLAYQRKHKLRPLTEDRGRTAYSCKAGKNWLTLALRDVEKRSKPGRAIEVLLEGGYFKLLISVPGKLDEPRTVNGSKLTAEEHLCDALRKRMLKEDPNAPDPTGRVQILDAGVIAGYLRARRPEDGEIATWSERFSITPLLEGLADWRTQHGQDRAGTVFVPDGSRNQLRRELQDFFLADSVGLGRTAWLLGPPGVGKTRLVLEAIAEVPALAQRMRVAWSPQAAESALDGRLFATYPRVVLVVDDCPAADVNHLSSLFTRRAPQDADVRLLVITPAATANETPKVGVRWSLGVLDDTALRQLVANELSASPAADAVRQIGELSQGYPWFAALLAKEAKEEGRSPDTLREAVQWALASKGEATTPVEATALRKRRARCLLAASLTRRVDWTRLEQDARERLAAAVGLHNWQQLMDSAEECVTRGILRKNLGWQLKYVTPLVLEREVIAMLLGPDGTDPGGRTLGHFGSEYFEDFYDTLRQLSLPAETIVCMTEAVLEDLQRASGWGSLQDVGLLGARLLFAAQQAPAAVARELNALIQRTDVSELLARRSERRGIAFALEIAILYAEAFHDAESALFRLAQAENEAYGNNATHLWDGLFFPSGQAVDLEERMRLLSVRVRSTDPVARRVAVGGVRALVTSHPGVRVSHALSRGFREPTSAEVRAARAEGWRLLGTCASDPEMVVASPARLVLISELRGAIRGGLGEAALAAAIEALPSFDEDTRIQLRAALAGVRAYDEKWIEPCGNRLRELEALLTPSTYSERVRQHVGAWGPAAERDPKREAAEDDAMVSEGLSGSAPLLDELDWLVSERAKRGHVFAYALGRCDSERVLWERLRRLARETSGWLPVAVCGRYIGGHAEAGRVALADELLGSLDHTSREADVFAVAVVELGADDERLRLVTEDLRSGTLSNYGVGELARRRGWFHAVTDAALEELVETLLRDPDPERLVAALELVVATAPKELVSASLLRKVLLKASRGPLHGMTGYYFRQGVLRLDALGDAENAALCAVTAVSEAEGGGAPVWKALEELNQAHPLATWNAIAHALDEGGPEAARLVAGFRFQRYPFAWPTDAVLDWVGEDERRSSVAVLMVRPEAGLHPIHRALIERFGANSPCARGIMTRFQSTEGVVSSLAAHDEQRLALVQSLLDDPVPAIREFGERLAERLRDALERHTTLEEDERRRWGT